MLICCIHFHYDTLPESVGSEVGKDVGIKVGKDVGSCKHSVLSKMSNSFLGVGTELSSFSESLESITCSSVLPLPRLFFPALPLPLL